MGTRWGPADDANKLTTLWRTPHNRVDSTKLDKDSVKAVHQAHFAHTKYANFDPLYRGKARAFNVSNTLDGHRKSKSFECCCHRTALLLQLSHSLVPQEALHTKLQKPAV